VAEGVYLPDHGAMQQVGDRGALFQIDKSISVYGGFVGTETALHQRDWDANKVVLSGDLRQNDNDSVAQNEPTRQDNALAVVSVADEVFVLVDGLEVTSAHGRHGISNDGPGEYHNLRVTKNFSDWFGAGLVLGSDDCPTVVNAVIENNVTNGYGGGAAIQCENGTLRNIVFRKNRGFLGGGLYTNPRSSTTIIDATFIDNDADAGAAIYNKDDLLLINGVIVGNGNDLTYGGGIQIEAADPPYGTLTVVNSVIAHNRGVQGGGIYALGSPVRVINSVVAFNHATSDGGGFHHRSTADTLEITNSIVWGNTADSSGPQLSYVAPGNNGGPVILTSSIFEGPIPDIVDDDGLTIPDDPLFVDPVGPDGEPGTLDDDFSLTTNSPAIDAGTNAALPPDSLDLDDDGDLDEAIPVDLLYNHRVHDAGGGLRVDIGPYEYDAFPVTVERRGLRGHDNPRAELYPNPAGERVIMIVDRVSRWGTVRVYDAIGRVVQVPIEVQRSDLDHRIVLDTRNLAPGLYFVVALVNDAELQAAFVVTR